MPKVRLSFIFSVIYLLYQDSGGKQGRLSLTMKGISPLRYKVLPPLSSFFLKQLPRVGESVCPLLVEGESSGK